MVSPGESNTLKRVTGYDMYLRLLLGNSSLGLLGATELLATVLAFLALLAGSLLDLHKTVLDKGIEYIVPKKVVRGNPFL